MSDSKLSRSGLPTITPVAMFTAWNQAFSVKGEDGKTQQQGRVVIGSGFTWNDDQQTPTPTYLSAKHGE